MAVSILRCPGGSRTAAAIARAWDTRDRDDVCLDSDVWKVTSPGSRIAVLSEANPRITLQLAHRTQEMGPVTERYVSFVLWRENLGYRAVTDIRTSGGDIVVEYDESPDVPVIEGSDLPSYYETRISSPRPDAVCTTSYIVCFGCVVTRAKEGWRVTINGNTIPVDRFTVCGDRIVFHREGSA